MRSVVGATSAYNHTLAEWFNNKLKLLSLNDENQYTVTSVYDFVNLLVFKKYILPLNRHLLSQVLNALWDYNKLTAG